MEGSIHPRRYIVIDLEDNRIKDTIPGYALDSDTIRRLKIFLEQQHIAYSENDDVDAW
jgi:hypothetical protein